MPGRDGSGPNERGPMTGRGMGYCVGNETVGFGRGMGRCAGLGNRGGSGSGRGSGFGTGRRGRGNAGFNQYQPGTITQREEQDQLRDIQTRLSKLEADRQG